MRWLYALVCIGVFFASVGLAAAGETKNVNETSREVKSAVRALAAAEARLSEARHVQSATRTYCNKYGDSVGRWVWLARDCGWKWEDISQLMYVIWRESRGQPRATNPSSSAAGLLQFMPQWYNGEWNLPAFDPYDPRQTMHMGLKLYKMQGWQPWVVY